MPAPNPTRELFRRESLLNGPYGSFRDNYQIVDAFERRVETLTNWDPSTINQAALRLITVANPNWQLTGTNAVATDQALNVDGGLDLVTAGADNDQVIISPRGQINSVDSGALGVVTWEPQHETRVHWILEIPAITAILVHAGVGLTAALDLTTDDDQAKFQFSTEGAVSTANFTAVESTGGTDTETDLGVAPVIATTLELEVRFSSSGIARWYVNGVKKHTSAAALTVGAAFIPFLGFQALAAAAKTVTVRGFRISRVWQDS